MNNILQLRGQFQKRKNVNGFGPTNLPKGSKITAEHVGNMKQQLKQLEDYWKNEMTIGGVLISVHYKCIVAKSNRLQILLGEKNSHPNMSIRGAKFVDENNAKNEKVKKHVFTYFISFEALRKSIQYLEKCELVLNKYYNGEITDKDTQASISRRAPTCPPMWRPPSKTTRRATPWSPRTPWWPWAS